jgi:CDP-glycerol glycerophosphotransferase (TagB/SpsB family)
MAIDRSGDYQSTFLTSDVLVSDTSSMLIEYLLTEKPIVYTHRIDLFNELGRSLSEGFYWARNATELTSTLEMLIAGKDPLRDKRKQLIKTLLFTPEGGSGPRIKEALKTHFRHANTKSAG